MDNEDEDQDDGTNDPFPFGHPPDVECYCDRIRVSSDPSVIERLRAAAGPPDPADLLRETREIIAAGDLFVRDEEFPPSVGRHGRERKQMDEKRARLDSDLTAAIDLLIEHDLLARRPGCEQMEQIYTFLDEPLTLWDLLPAFGEAGCAFGFDAECVMDNDDELTVRVVRHDILLIDEFQRHSGGIFHPTNVSQCIRDWTVYVRFVHDGRAYEVELDYAVEDDFCDPDILAAAANCALWKSGRPERFLVVPEMDQGANFIFTGKIDALRALESSGLVDRFGLDDPRHFL